MIEIRFKTYVSVMYLVAGAVAAGSIPLALLTDELHNGMLSFLVLAPLFLAAGFLALSKPYLSYDVARDSVELRGPFGNTVRTFGSPKGERIAFNGVHVVRVFPDGRQKKISTGSGRDEDVRRLIQYLVSIQQPPPPPQR